MRLPPEPVLQAATRWLDLLPKSGGVARAQALLTTHPSYDDLTPTQYASALTWIRESGLLDTVSSPVPVAQRVLCAVLEHGQLPWFQDADQLVQSPGELPTDILLAGSALGLDADQVYGHLLAIWGKVNTEARERVGAAGEAALMAALQSHTGATVTQVSAWSDGFGFDIDFSAPQLTAHIEVKSTTRLGRLTVYLSRNEYEVMLRDENWVLVAVRLSSEMDLQGTGSIPKDWVADNAPRDFGSAGHWASCKLEIPPEAIADGIPRIRSAMSCSLPSWT